MFRKIVVYNTLVNRFKREAIKALPHEHIVAVLGKTTRGILYIHAFDLLKITSKKNNSNKIEVGYHQPEAEIEAGTTLKYFGTLHTHPNEAAIPSEIDIIDFREKYNNEYYTFDGYENEHLRDVIMGIMSLTKKGKSFKYELVFYNIDINIIELEIRMTKNAKRKNKG